MVTTNNEKPIRFIATNNTTRDLFFYLFKPLLVFENLLYEVVGKNKVFNHLYSILYKT